MKYQEILKKVIEKATQKSGKKSWKKELPEILNLGQNAIYKRLNGTTPFTIEELMKLASHYKFSLSDILEEKKDGENDVVFTIPHKRKIHSFSDFIKPIHDDILMLSKLTEKKVHYAANDIPIFWYFYFEPLLLFKYFMWGRMVWTMPMMQGRKVSFSNITFSPYERDLIETVKSHYEQIDNVEYWTDYALETTMHQIKFCVKAQLFESREDLDKIVETMFDLLKFLYEILESGKKKNLGNVEIYHNGLAHTNTCALVESLEGDAVYTIFKNPNMMKSTSPRIVAETKEWFQSLAKHSVILSRSSEMNRLTYLNQLEERLIKFKEDIVNADYGLNKGVEKSFSNL